MVPAYRIPHALTFKDALKKGASLELTTAKNRSEDIAVLQYTGGTTGVSKGAQLSHGNIIAHNSMITAMVQALYEYQWRTISIVTAITTVSYLCADGEWNAHVQYRCEKRIDHKCAGYHQDL